MQPNSRASLVPHLNWDDRTLSDAQRVQLAEIMDHCLELLEQGDRINADTLCARHPELADGIRHYLDGLQFLHDAAAGFRPQHQDRTRDNRGDGPPGQLGNYRLLREIGRGGMGVVYEAEDVLINRRVAVKLLPFAALLDQKQIARFQNEARAAGQLHHPHIVPVYSVGTDRGIHYFAMQFIAGRSLRELLDEMALRDHDPNSTSHCGPSEPAAAPAVPGVPQPIAHTTHSATQSSRALTRPDVSTLRQSAISTAGSSNSRDTIRAAARIAADVADALEHAHAHGVIHRDVKPANLLLDEASHVWVTDFGLARAPQESGVTMSGDVMGTIRYMSPEQAAGKTAYVDHRTDIYSLGVTLYELLTLRPAFPTANRQLFLREIETAEPPKPRQLNRSIPIDLENVVLKAISKDPATRYGTASAMAADLRRFLHGMPTLARRPTLVDRAAKWTRRHSRLVAASFGVMALMLAGLVIAILLIAGAQGRMRRALAESRESNQRAERYLGKTRDAFDEVMLLSERLKTLPGAESLRHDLLNHLLASRESVIEEAVDTPEQDTKLTLDLAVAYMKAGELTKQLGDVGQARDYFARSLAAFSRLRQVLPQDAHIQAHQARARNNRGLLRMEMSDLEGAMADFDAAILAHTTQSTSAGPTDLAVTDREKMLDDLSCAYLNRAQLNSMLHRFDASRRDYLEAMTMCQQLVRLDPSSRSHRNRLAVLHQNLSAARLDTDPGKAEASCLQAMQINAQLVDEDSGDLLATQRLAASKNQLGRIRSMQSRFEEAAENHRDALTIAQELVLRAPLVVAYRVALGESHHLLGNVHALLGDLVAAEQTYRESQEVFAILLKAHPESARFHSSLGSTMFNRGQAIFKRGQALGRLSDLAEATRLCEQGIEHQRQAVQLAPKVDIYRQFLQNQTAAYAALKAQPQP